MTRSWRKQLGFLVVMAMMFVSLVSVVQAASAPNIFTYQGRVLNANGVPVSDASLSMSFALYTAVTGGSCVWSNSSASCATTTAKTVTLTTGLFTENLGDTGNSYAAIGDSIFGDNAALYLEVIIAGETLTPRRAITAAPYALNADTLDGIDSATLQLFETGSSRTFEDDAPVIIGTNVALTYGSSGVGDLRVEDELEVMGDGYIDNDLVVGASTSSTETISNAGFSLSGDDLFVAGTFGVEGNLYTDGDVVITGDDLFMGTNTSGFILVADGTNFNPVDVSGDIDISSSGVVTVQADSVALSTDTTGNYVVSVGTSVLTGLTGGAVGSEGAALSLAFDYSQALSGDVGLSANAGVFGTSGIVFEGSTADTIETFLAVLDPTAFDKTITFPNLTGTVILSGHTFTGDVTATLGASNTTALTVAADSIALSTDTTGNYVATIADAGGSDITVTGSGSEGASVTLDITADAIDFDEMADALSLDASTSIAMDGTETFTVTDAGTGNVIVNLSSTGDFVIQDNSTAILTIGDNDVFSYSTDLTTTDAVSFSGNNLTTGSLFSLSSSALTTGSAFNVAATNANTANSAARLSQFIFTNSQSSSANTDIAGLLIGFTNNPSVAGNTERVMSISNAVTSNTTDNTITALLALDNADSSTSGSTVVTDAISITVSGLLTDGIVDAIDASDANITNALNFGTNTLQGSTGNIDMTNFDVVGSSGNVTLGGDLTVSGDDLFLGTNTTGFFLVADGTNYNPVSMSGDVSLISTGATTIQANAIALSTDTTGNYVATIADAGGSDITVTGSGSEGASVTLDITADAIDFDEMADALSLDASTSIAMDGSETFTVTDGGTGNVIVNLSSTGDFEVQDNGTAALTVNDSGNTVLAGDLTISGDDLTMTTNTSGFILVADGTNYNPVAVSSDATLSSTGAFTIAANAIALSTDTTGNYVATIADAGGSDITVTGSGSEGASVTLDITADAIDFDEMADALSLDASTSIAMDAAEQFGITNGSSDNILFNLTSTGDFVIQDSGSPFLTFADNRTIDFVTVATTGTAFAMDFDSITTGIGLDITANGLTSGRGIRVRADNSLDGTSGSAIQIDYETASPTAEMVFEIESDCAGESTCASTSDDNTVLSIDSTGNILTDVGIAAQGNVDVTINAGASLPLAIGADVFSSGTLMNVSYTTAETLTGMLIGQSFDLKTNVTSTNGVAVSGSVVLLPAFTQTSTDTTEYKGMYVKQPGALVQSTAAGQIAWDGVEIDMPNITQTTGTITSSGVSIGMGTITTGGTQYGINVSPNTASAGTLQALHIGNITGGAGTEQAINIGSGWDTDIVLQNNETIDNSTNNLVAIKKGDGTVYLSAGDSTLSMNLDNTITNTQRLCHSGADGATGVVSVGDCQAAGQADYAEMYAVDNSATYGDIVVSGDFSVTTIHGDSVARLEVSDRSYQPSVVGVVVNNYEDGSVVGHNIEASDNPMPIALAGRVLVNVTDENGAIEVGDAITTSSTKGFGMKATKPGMIVGYALDSLESGSGQIMVYVNTSWFAGDVLNTDGVSTIVTDNVIVSSVDTASSEDPTFDSFGLALRGSAWNGSEAQAVEMMLRNVVDDEGSYRLSIRNTSETEVAYITNEGTMKIAGDMVISGRLYPSDRGTPQIEKYIYYDGSAGAGGDFMRTNAKGWSAGSYDFAEMFPSDESLTSGDVVVFSGSGETVKRSLGAEGERLAGIVSTRPGFLAGENVDGAYPIALAGRVPTKVSIENGTIAVGEPLTSSSIAGTAMKATDAGQVIGYALENFIGSESDNFILVSVNVGYWSGGPQTITIVQNQASQVSSDTQSFSALNMSGNIYMATNQILSIGRLEGVSGIWSIESDGTIKTSGSLTTMTESYQGTKVETMAVTSPESVITLTGTATLVEGRAEVRFEEVIPEYNDVISAVAPIRVIVTPSGPVSLYVSEKDQNHFIVERFVGSADVEFDWMVTGYRKGFEPEVDEVEEVAPGFPATHSLGEGWSLGESEEAQIPSDLSEPEQETLDEAIIDEEPEPVVEEEPASPESPDEPLIDSATTSDDGAPAEPTDVVIETPSTPEL